MRVAIRRGERQEQGVGAALQGAEGGLSVEGVRISVVRLAAMPRKDLKPHAFRAPGVQMRFDKAKDILKKAGYGWDGSGRLTLPAR